MQLNRRNYTCISVLLLGVIGSAVQLSNPVMAGESIRLCMRDLMNDSISETNAAIACRHQQDSHQRDSNWGKYRNRNRGRYLDLQARSGPTPEGRWRYSAPGVPYDAMRRAGCEHIKADDWRCPTRRLQVDVHNDYGSFIQFPQPPEPAIIFPF